MIETRQANVEDLNELAILFEAYRRFYRQQPAAKKAADFLQNRLINKDSTIFVATDTSQQKIVGFTQLYPSFTSTRLQKSWILNDLFVDSQSRGLGVSKKLISAAKQYCVETKAFGLLLETERTNIIGNKLYPSVGFKKEQNNFYYWINE